MLYLQLQKTSPEELTKNVVDMQQIPGIEMTGSKKTCCLGRTVFNGR